MRIRRRSWSTGVGLWLVVLVLVAEARADQPRAWSSNLDFLRGAASQSVAELAKDLPTAPSPLRVTIRPPHEAGTLVEELLKRELRQRGHAVLADSVAAPHLNLSVNVEELGLRYTRTQRIFLFGEKRVERLAVASLAGELSDPADGVVSWSQRAAHRRLDEVPLDKLPILEGADYPLTPPSLPASKAGRIVEPLVVSAIVVGLVVLFASNRN